MLRMIPANSGTHAPSRNKFLQELSKICVKLILHLINFFLVWSGFYHLSYSGFVILQEIGQTSTHYKRHLANFHTLLVIIIQQKL